MRLNFRLWGIYAAILVIAACTKDDVRKAAPPVNQNKPDTIVYKPPVDNGPIDNGTSLTDDTHLLLGNPTDAQRNLVQIENYLMDQKYFVEAYSKNRGTPVWVSWHLSSDDIGSSGRSDNFHADPNLPLSWYAVNENSYKNSGFDRGHNCPSGDRTSTAAANNATFLMTNMIPQAPMLNQGPWEGLEDYARNTLVGTGYEAWIIMGSYGKGGKNSSATSVSSVDNGNVNVPASVWKVVLVIPKGNNDLSRIDANATIVAIDMPNDNTLYTTSGTGKSAWKNYVVTVNDLETRVNAAFKDQGITLNLFKNIPEGIRTQLKAKLFK
ncbi:DNA/RNA endonuclease G (NUC1) [Chitinophaga dinghuensis]|uniref:DNA/RNA endonuclease G (NUC1) n=1 Tax=Chitinophaga dinghuensis TaxID=1539050 RepID=A0A327VLI3_9BACT|nr:DNA/RNA non-specific endonuclease [Chitinophaga dinghuensis]RAJ75654.1 DNA/RNA endonuclease G (NUC1) [Chitinophaga dinghuensis]